jgi:hypothetical protein
MALRIAVDPAARQPSLPAGGGTIDIVFTAHDPSRDSQLQATYTLPPEMPYEFAHAPGRIGPRVVKGRIESVTIGLKQFEQRLTLRPVAGPAVRQLFVDVSVQELGDDGTPRVLAGQAVPPIESTVIVDVE